jgi:hypothetical protein
MFPHLDCFAPLRNLLFNFSNVKMPQGPSTWCDYLDELSYSIRNVTPAKKLRIAIPILSFVFAVSSAPAVGSRAHNPLANCTILIIRHAEKPDLGPDLTPAGQARARSYVGFFEHLKLDGKKFQPRHLFAAADSKDSHRPRLTLTPLSQAMKMPLDERFGSKDVAGIAQDLETHRYGKDVLICWRHGKIPALMSALGANPSPLFSTGKWPGHVYDWMVELKFDDNGRIKQKDVRLLHEHLMPGDES